MDDNSVKNIAKQGVKNLLSTKTPSIVDMMLGRGTEKTIDSDTLIKEIQIRVSESLNNNSTYSTVTEESEQFLRKRVLQSMPTATIFLVSSGLIIAIRIAAYYNEELSKDIAKLLPFALLGIFLFNPQFFTFSDILSRLLEMPSFVIQIASFMVVVMFVEIILSTLYIVKIKFFPKKDKIDLDDYSAPA